MKKYFPNKHPIVFFSICLAVLFFFSPLLAISSSAQPKETPDSIRFKTLGCLYRAIQALNDRNVRFKALQEELEDMHPLEPQSMDSSHITSNIAKVRKYLLFLESHRSQLGKNVRVFSDSILILSALMNTDEEKGALVNFLKAYKEESAAFINYSQRLSLMLTDTRNALMFLLTVPMERKGNDVTFNTDKSANEKYLDFESKISADQMQVDQAIERSIKMTEKENKVIMEATTLLNK